MSLEDWAAAYGVAPVALHALRDILGAGYRPPLPHDTRGKSEAAVSARVRLDAAANGGVLWRNNVGACTDNRGNFIRYGLANDSKEVNAVVKSSDLVGITPIVVTPGMVGALFGQFTAVETKPEGWVYTGTPREKAQKKFLEITQAHGGLARFSTGEKVT
jgi:hypothetical protein